MIYHKFVFLSLVAVLIGCSPKSKQWLTHDVNVSDITIHSSSGFVAPCEPTICISPKDPNVIIAGSVLNNVYISKDKGKTWQKEKLESTYGVYGDPVVRIDNKGTIYYAHLSNPDGKAYRSVSFLDRIVVQKSIDEGKSWTNGTFPPGDTLTDHDKHWLAIDPANDHVLMSWTEFDKYGSKDLEDKSRILFSKSEDNGQSWTKPIAVSQYEGDCIDDDQTTEGCVPAVGTDGSYILVWAYDDKIFFDKSIDKGDTWMDRDKIIAEQPGGWTYDIPGLGRCNGMPIVEVDHSDGEHRGTIYVNWSDQRNGPDDTDIWLIKSTDGGNTWSPPKRVNDDKKGNHQFLTWMDVDPITGYIYIVFYDRRGLEDNHTNVYLAYSKDGGDTFRNIQINEKSFQNKENVFFGDYNDISAYNGIVRPIWTQQNEFELSVHTAVIDFE